MKSCKEIARVVVNILYIRELHAQFASSLILSQHNDENNLRSTKFPSVQHDEHFRTPALMPRTHCQNTSATNHFNRPFQALSKNVFIPAGIALSALETFLFNVLYKFTYLLTYLVTSDVRVVRALVNLTIILS